MILLPSVIRNPIRRVVLGCAALALAGCTLEMPQMGGGGGGSVDPTQPVPVALLVPQSDANAKTLPRDLENAARLAVESLSGAQIDLRVYDTAGAPDVAATVAQQAVDEGAQILVGPFYQRAAAAAATAVADEGTPVLSFSNNSAIAGGNLFLLGTLFDSAAQRMTGYALSQGLGSAVVLYDDTAGGRLARNAVIAAGQQQGMQITGQVAYDLDFDSLSAAIAEARSLIDTTGAQAIFLTDNWDQGLGIALQLLPEQGIRPEEVQFIGLSRWDIRSDAFSLRGIQNGWFAIPDKAAQDAFNSRYEDRFGAPPHPLAGLAFDGIAAIGALVSQGDRDALSIRALTQPAGFQGVAGVFRLEADGRNQRALSVATVQDNEVVILDPAPRSFGGF